MCFDGTGRYVWSKRPRVFSKPPTSAPWTVAVPTRAILQAVISLWCWSLAVLVTDVLLTDMLWSRWLWF